MGTKNAPGKFDCYSKADPDEPVFVLLGRDPIASFCVTLWAELNRAVNAAEPHCAEKSAEALACSSAMHEYACSRGADEDVQRVAGAFFSLIGVCEFVAAAVGRDAVRDLVPKFERTPDMQPAEPPPGDWDALRSLDKAALKTMGCVPWDEPDAEGQVLMLFPHEWYDSIPEGYELTCISGSSEKFKRGETDNDKRFGCLAYGIVVRA